MAELLHSECTPKNCFVAMEYDAFWKGGRGFYGETKRMSLGIGKHPTKAL